MLSACKYRRNERERAEEKRREMVSVCEGAHRAADICNVEEIKGALAPAQDLHHAQRHTDEGGANYNEDQPLPLVAIKSDRRQAECGPRQNRQG